MELDRDELIEVRDSLEYIQGVFPSYQKRLVEEGAVGDEVHTITGDDLAGACWHLSRLMEIFDVGSDS